MVVVALHQIMAPWLQPHLDNAVDNVEKLVRLCRYCAPALCVVPVADMLVSVFFLCAGYSHPWLYVPFSKHLPFWGNMLSFERCADTKSTNPQRLTLFSLFPRTKQEHDSLRCILEGCDRNLYKKMLGQSSQLNWRLPTRPRILTPPRLSFKGTSFV
jgi:hypothetical protein